MQSQVARGGACVKRSEGAWLGRGLLGAWPPAGASRGSGFTETGPALGRLSEARVKGRGPGAPSGAPSFEPPVADSPPAPRPGMRSLSLAWLLGGIALLAASVSCNRTENFARGELERRRKALGWWGNRGRRALPRASRGFLGSFNGCP